MSDINPNRMIPLHVADAAVAACEKEIQALRETVDTLETIIRRDREYTQDLVLEVIVLKKELESLRASSFVTAVPSEDYEKLKAEVARLHTLLSIAERNVQNLLRTPEWTQIAELTADYRELAAENERLRKAGDRMASALNGEYNHELDCVKDWNAAKQPPTDPTK